MCSASFRKIVGGTLCSYTFLLETIACYGIIVVPAWCLLVCVRACVRAHAYFCAREYVCVCACVLLTSGNVINTTTDIHIYIYNITMNIIGDSERFVIRDTRWRPPISATRDASAHAGSDEWRD